MGNCAAPRARAFRLSPQQLNGEFPEDDLEFYMEINELLDRWSHNHVSLLKSRFLDAVSGDGENSFNANSIHSGSGTSGSKLISIGDSNSKLTNTSGSSKPTGTNGKVNANATSTGVVGGRFTSGGATSSSHPGFADAEDLIVTSIDPSFNAGTQIRTANMTILEQQGIAAQQDYSTNLGAELNLEGFLKLFQDLQDLPKSVAESAFRMFDSNNDGRLNFREFLSSLALCCHLMSSDGEKIRFVFDMFDINDSEKLSVADIEILLDKCYTNSRSVNIQGQQGSDANLLNPQQGSSSDEKPNIGNGILAGNSVASNVAGTAGDKISAQKCAEKTLTSEEQREKDQIARETYILENLRAMKLVRQMDPDSLSSLNDPNKGKKTGGIRSLLPTLGSSTTMSEGQTPLNYHPSGAERSLLSRGGKLIYDVSKVEPSLTVTGATNDLKTHCSSEHTANTGWGGTGSSTTSIGPIYVVERDGVTFEEFYEWGRNHLTEITTLLHTFQLVQTPERERYICEEILAKCKIPQSDSNQDPYVFTDKKQTGSSTLWSSTNLLSVIPRYWPVQSGFRAGNDQPWRYNPWSAGQVWYVISSKWFQTWRSYVQWEHDAQPRKSSLQGTNSLGGTTASLGTTDTIFNQHLRVGEPHENRFQNGGAWSWSRPNEIDNTDLESREYKGCLRSGLVETQDYELIPSELWSRLESWYGILSTNSLRLASPVASPTGAVVRCDSGPMNAIRISTPVCVFPRKVMRHGIVELYPALVHLTFEGRSKKCFISCQARIDEVMAVVRQKFRISVKDRSLEIARKRMPDIPEQELLEEFNRKIALEGEAGLQSQADGLENVTVPNPDLLGERDKAVTDETHMPAMPTEFDLEVNTPGGNPENNETSMTGPLSNGKNTDSATIGTKTATTPNTITTKGPPTSAQQPQSAFSSTMVGRGISALAGKYYTSAESKKARAKEWKKFQEETLQREQKRVEREMYFFLYFRQQGQDWKQLDLARRDVMTAKCLNDLMTLGREGQNAIYLYVDLRHCPDYYMDDPNCLTNTASNLLAIESTTQSHVNEGTGKGVLREVGSSNREWAPIGKDSSPAERPTTADRSPITAEAGAEAVISRKPSSENETPGTTKKEEDEAPKKPTVATSRLALLSGFTRGAASPATPKKDEGQTPKKETSKTRSKASPNVASKDEVKKKVDWPLAADGRHHASKDALRVEDAHKLNPLIDFLIGGSGQSGRKINLQGQKSQESAVQKEGPGAPGYGSYHLLDEREETLSSAATEWSHIQEGHRAQIQEGATAKFGRQASGSLAAENREPTEQFPAAEPFLTAEKPPMGRSVSQTSHNMFPLDHTAAVFSGSSPTASLIRGHHDGESVGNIKRLTSPTVPIDVVELLQAKFNSEDSRETIPFFVDSGNTSGNATEDSAANGTVTATSTSTGTTTGATNNETGTTVATGAVSAGDGTSRTDNTGTRGESSIQNSSTRNNSRKAEPVVIRPGHVDYPDPYLMLGSMRVSLLFGKAGVIVDCQPAEEIIKIHFIGSSYHSDEWFSLLDLKKSFHELQERVEKRFQVRFFGRTPSEEENSFQTKGKERLVTADGKQESPNQDRHRSRDGPVQIRGMSSHSVQNTHTDWSIALLQRLGTDFASTTVASVKKSATNVGVEKSKEGVAHISSKDGEKSGKSIVGKEVEKTKVSMTTSILGSVWPNAAQKQMIAGAVDLKESLPETGLPPTIPNSIRSDVLRVGDVGPPPGLRNLGNSCFLNSVVQSLVCTPLLKEYFVEDRSRELAKLKVNSEERQLVLDFGVLVREFYDAKVEVREVNIARFKRTVDLVAPYFAGYQQHDAQEVLMFLLDGLHNGTVRSQRGAKKVYSNIGGKVAIGRRTSGGLRSEKRKGSHKKVVRDPGVLRDSDLFDTIGSQRGLKNGQKDPTNGPKEITNETTNGQKEITNETTNCQRDLNNGNGREERTNGENAMHSDKKRPDTPPLHPSADGTVVAGERGDHVGGLSVADDYNNLEIIDVVEPAMQKEELVEFGQAEHDNGDPGVAELMSDTNQVGNLKKDDGTSVSGAGVATKRSTVEVLAQEKSDLIRPPSSSSSNNPSLNTVGNRPIALTPPDTANTARSAGAKQPILAHQRAYSVPAVDEPQIKPTAPTKKSTVFSIFFGRRGQANTTSFEKTSTVELPGSTKNGSGRAASQSPSTAVTNANHTTQGRPPALSSNRGAVGNLLGSIYYGRAKSLPPKELALSIENAKNSGPGSKANTGSASDGSSVQKSVLSQSAEAVATGNGLGAATRIGLGAVTGSGVGAFPALGHELGTPPGTVIGTAPVGSSVRAGSPGGVAIPGQEATSSSSSGEMVITDHSLNNDSDGVVGIPVSIGPGGVIRPKQIPNFVSPIGLPISGTAISTTTFNGSTATFNGSSTAFNGKAAGNVAGQQSPGAGNTGVGSIDETTGIAGPGEAKATTVAATGGNFPAGKAVGHSIAAGSVTGAKPGAQNVRTGAKAQRWWKRWRKEEKTTAVLLDIGNQSGSGGNQFSGSDQETVRTDVVTGAINRDNSISKWNQRPGRSTDQTVSANNHAEVALTVTPGLFGIYGSENTKTGNDMVDRNMAIAQNFPIDDDVGPELVGNVVTDSNVDKSNDGKHTARSRLASLLFSSNNTGDDSARKAEAKKKKEGEGSESEGQISSSAVEYSDDNSDLDTTPSSSRTPTNLRMDQRKKASMPQIDEEPVCQNKRGYLDRLFWRTNKEGQYDGALTGKLPGAGTTVSAAKEIDQSPDGANLQEQVGNTMVLADATKDDEETKEEARPSWWPRKKIQKGKATSGASATRGVVAGANPAGEKNSTPNKNGATTAVDKNGAIDKNGQTGDKNGQTPEKNGTTADKSGQRNNVNTRSELAAVAQMVDIPAASEDEDQIEDGEEKYESPEEAGKEKYDSPDDSPRPSSGGKDARTGLFGMTRNKGGKLPKKESADEATTETPWSARKKEDGSNKDTGASSKKETLRKEVGSAAENETTGKKEATSKKETTGKKEEDVKEKHLLEEPPAPPKQASSVIVDLFEGLLRSKLQCQTCMTVKPATFESFRGLSLGIPTTYSKKTFNITFYPSMGDTLKLIQGDRNGVQTTNGSPKVIDGMPIGINGNDGMGSPNGSHGKTFSVASGKLVFQPPGLLSGSRASDNRSDVNHVRTPTQPSAASLHYQVSISILQQDVSFAQTCVSPLADFYAKCRGSPPANGTLVPLEGSFKNPLAPYRRLIFAEIFRSRVQRILDEGVALQDVSAEDNLVCYEVEVGYPQEQYIEPAKSVVPQLLGNNDIIPPSLGPTSPTSAAAATRAASAAGANAPVALNNNMNGSLNNVVPSPTAAGRVLVLICHRRVVIRKSFYRRERFGTPLILCFDLSQNYTDLHVLIRRQVSRFMRHPEGERIDDKNEQVDVNGEDDLTPSRKILPPGLATAVATPALPPISGDTGRSGTGTLEAVTGNGNGPRTAVKKNSKAGDDPYVCRIVNPNGVACGACRKPECVSGCILPKDNRGLKFYGRSRRLYLALDWIDPLSDYEDPVKHEMKNFLECIDEPNVTYEPDVTCHIPAEFPIVSSKGVEREVGSPPSGTGWRNISPPLGIDIEVGNTSKFAVSKSIADRKYGPGEVTKESKGQKNDLKKSKEDSKDHNKESKLIPSSPLSLEVPLSSCLDSFRQVEYLLQEEGNGVKCERCQKVRSFSKQLEINRDPDILVLHIKRFYYRSGRYAKIHVPIRVPSDLDLSPYCSVQRGRSTPPFYALYAMVCHLGETIGEGHYISYVCNNYSTSSTVIPSSVAAANNSSSHAAGNNNNSGIAGNGNNGIANSQNETSSNGNGIWYKCDDQVVTRVDSFPQVSDSCYILFYRKHTISSSNLINYTHLRWI